MIKKILYFYIDGFTNMKLGKRLWILIIIKLLILFALIKYFFPNILEEKFNTDAQRGNYVLQQLTKQGDINGTH